MRDTSSTSSMSLVCARALRSTMPMALAAVASSRFPCMSSAVQPTMAFSGVRSSWDNVARNWSFSRFASSASRRSWVRSSTRRSSSACAARRSASRRCRPSTISLKVATRMPTSSFPRGTARTERSPRPETARALCASSRMGAEMARRAARPTRSAASSDTSDTAATMAT